MFRQPCKFSVHVNVTDNVVSEDHALISYLKFFSFFFYIFLQILHFFRHKHAELQLSWVEFVNSNYDNDFMYIWLFRTVVRYLSFNFEHALILKEETRGPNK